MTDSNSESDSTYNHSFVFTLSSDLLESLPTRGMINILSLSPGIVLHNDKLYARGSRDDEIKYLIDGVPVTDVMNGGYLIELPQEAFERIDIHTGGVSVKYGNANSGFVFQKLKRGTNEFKAGIKYLSDNITSKNSSDAFDGEKRLGTYWFGHNEIIGQLSGPIIKDKLTFYTLAHYKYERDQNPQPFPGANTDWIHTEWEKWYSNYSPEYIPENLIEDSLKIILKEGPQPANSMMIYGAAGNLSFNTNKFDILLSGVYQYKERYLPDGNNVLNFMNYSRTPKYNSEFFLASIKIGHKILSNLNYEFTIAYSNNYSQQYDPLLKDDFLNYYNAAANAHVGVNNFINSYTDPRQKNIKGYCFNLPGYITTGYSKENISMFSFNLAAILKLTDNFIINFGGGINYKTIRQYEINREVLKEYAWQLHENNIIVSEQELQLIEGINNYGYDAYANIYNRDDCISPKKPLFTNLFLENRFSTDDVNISVGLRVDRYDIDNVILDYREIQQYDLDDVRIKDNYFSPTKATYHISPRISLNFKISPVFSIYSNYGKYTQNVKFSNIYQGVNKSIWNTRYYGKSNKIGFDLEPISTSLAELGLSVSLKNSIKCNLKIYSKSTAELPSLFFLNGWFSPVIEYLANYGVTTSTGTHFSILYNNSSGFSGIANFALENTSGKSIYYDSWMGIRKFSIQVVSPGLWFIQIPPAPVENSYKLSYSLLMNYEFDNNFLKDFTLSTIIRYKSGHPYTRFSKLNLNCVQSGGWGFFQSNNHIGAFNSHTTPSTFQIDLKVSKSIQISDNTKITLAFVVLNLFDTINHINVFPTSGTTDSDNYYDSEYFVKCGYLYGEDFPLLYDTVNINYYDTYKRATGFNLFGPPRQIFFGVTLEY